MKERKLSEPPMTYPTEGHFVQVLSIARDMRKELRQWNNGGAVKHLGPYEIARIFNRCEAVMTLMIQEMECSVDEH